MKNFRIVLRTRQTSFKQTVNFKFSVIVYQKNNEVASKNKFTRHRLTVFERNARQLVKANENLAGITRECS